MPEKPDDRHPLSLERARLYAEQPKTEEAVADWNARVENYNARLVAEGFSAKAGLFKKKIVKGPNGEVLVRPVYD